MRESPAVAVASLRFTYRAGAPPVVDGLSARFEAGTITVVTGPSGRGKSTILYLIGLMLLPTDGSIWIHGAPTSGLSDARRSELRGREIGFVFQDALLDPSRTVLDNVLEGSLYGGDHDVEGALDLLAETGVQQRVDHRPGEISGGQAQRVALCRALIKRPSIILADEPTGNLDAETGELVWSILRARAAAGATVIVATHDLVRASSADACLRL